MKNRIAIFILGLLFFSCAKKEEKKQNLKDVSVFRDTTLTTKEDALEIKEEVQLDLVFTVQIAALKNNNQQLLNLENIATYQENGLIKYRLGSFKRYKDAKIYRNNLRNKFKDAFIQALQNDKPIEIKQALQY